MSDVRVEKKKQSIKRHRHTTHVDINTVKPESHSRYMRQYPDCITASGRETHGV